MANNARDPRKELERFMVITEDKQYVKSLLEHADRVIAQGDVPGEADRWGRPYLQEAV